MLIFDEFFELILANRDDKEFEALVRAQGLFIPQAEFVAALGRN
ncbi:hypothetical protein S58_15110 [Bradyrhizobium oligotrophicum S58]|uniref:Uncharacterized protein n=1 Tax=Bradyrhizobium oligotrophicum S58 TaxID=1245469 RepID=M4Z382_9BRAD|nr:hypothetical protein [Bradyrhizobium oligotrophicum]BAM87519.1 hypothetical protein S58_15110 [Bradyrhizobium oligotrophicum S58]